MFCAFQNPTVLDEASQHDWIVLVRMQNQLFSDLLVFHQLPMASLLGSVNSG